MFKLENIKLWFAPHLAVVILAPLAFLFHAFWWNVPLDYDASLHLNEAFLQNYKNGFLWTAFVKDPRALAEFVFYLLQKHTTTPSFWLRMINSFIHAGNVFVGYLLIKRFCKSSFLPTTLALGFFAFHPINSLAVQSGVQLSLLLATFFGFLALLSATAPSPKHGLTVLFYYLACHSKEQAFFFIIPLLAIYLSQCQYDLRRINKLPLLALITTSAMTLYFRHQIAFTVYEPLAENVLNNPVFSQTKIPLYLLSALNQCWLFFRYVYFSFVWDLRFIAIEAPQPFLTSLWHPELIFGFLGFSFLALKIYQKYLREENPSLYFLLLISFSLFLSELSTVRLHENFVFYRAYIWMLPLLPLLAYALDKFPALFKKPLPMASLLAFMALLGFSKTSELGDGFKTWQRAVSLLNVNDNSVPASYRVYLNYAIALGNQERYEDSFKNFQMAASLNPKHAPAFDGMGACLAKSRNFKEALPYFEKSLQLNASSFNTRLNYITALENLNRTDEALKNLEILQNIKPADPSLMFVRGRLHSRRNEEDEAFFWYSRLLSVDPRHVGALVARGKIYKKQKNHSLASTDFKNALQWGGLKYATLLDLGQSYLHLAQNEEALKTYKAALNLEPKRPEALYNVAVALFRLNNKDAAREHLNQALIFDKEFKPAHSLLALLK